MQSTRFRILRAVIFGLLLLAYASMANAQVDRDHPFLGIDGPPQELETITVRPPPQPKPPLSSGFLTWGGGGQQLVSDIGEGGLFERNRGEHVLLRDASQGGPCPGTQDGDTGSNPAHANPIVLSTGDKVEPEVDFDSFGEMPLTLVRTYNHNWSYVGIFGMYWVSNLDYSITIAQDELTVYSQRPDGRRIKFARDPGNSNRWWEDRSVGTPIANISRTGTGTAATYTYVTEDNYVEVYDYEGRITQRWNINGVSWKFSYTNRFLTSVTRLSGRGDGSGRTLTLVWVSNMLYVVGPDASSTNTYTFNTTSLDGVRRLDTVQLAGDVGSPLTTVAYQYEDARFPGALTGKSYNSKRYSTFAYDSSSRATDSKHAGATPSTYVDAYHFDYTGTLTNPPPGPSDPPPPGVPCDPVTHQCNPLPNGSNTTAASTEKTLVRMIPAATNSVTETNPLGFQTTYTYVDGQLTWTTSPGSAHCGARTSSRTYDTYGYDNIITDFNGNQTDYDYLPTGQLQRKIEGSGSTVSRTTSYTWEPYGGYNLPLTKTISGLNKTTYTYWDFSNRIKSIAIDNLAPYGNADSHVWNYTYTLWSGITGMVQSMTVDGPLLGDSVTTTYNQDGDVLTVTTPTGTTTYSGYNAWGEPTHVQGENGEINDYAYYPRGKLKSITTYPNGTTAATTTYVYADELLFSVATPNGVTTSYTYDNARRLWTTSRPEIAGTATRTLTYDAGSNVTQIDNTLNGTLKRRASFAYDELDRVRTRSGTHSQSYTYTYDNNGNLKTAKDSYLKTTTYQYDSLNRVSGWAGPLQTNASFTYDAADLLKTATDPHGVLTTYNRDGFGQLWKEISPDRGTTNYVWLSDGTLDTMTRGNNVQTAYQFDPTGRLTNVAASGQSETFTYDTCTNGHGRICSATAPNTTLTYTYEPNGRVRTRQDQIRVAGVLSSYTTSYTYDTVGRLWKLTYPNNELATYTYTTGQPSSLTMTIAGITKTIVSAVSFEPFGPLSGYRHTNGLVRDYTFDLDGRYQGITSKNGTTALQSLGFGYDNDDRITTITNSQPDHSKTYGYDDLSHLTSATNAVLPLNLGYSYDGNDNRLTMDPNSSVYTYYPGTNRVSSVSTPYIAPDGSIGFGGSAAPGPAYNTSVLYDGAGNIKEWDIPGLTAVYVYDGFNRMTTVLGNSVTFGVYGYNAFGERTNKQDLTDGNNFSFIYGEGHQLIADKEDAVWTNYLWFAGEIVAMTRAGTPYDIDSDQLGRPELVTDGSKTVVWQVNNVPFGRCCIPPAGTIEFNIGFPGQYYDKETHYWYNVNRYYIEPLGRYLQPDPIALTSGLNPYAYVGANPVSYIDPLGLAGVTIGLFVGRGAVVTVGKSDDRWFFRGTVGVGLGATVSFDPDAKFPTGNKDAPRDHCALIGARVGAGLNAGPLGGGLEAAEGGEFSTSALTGQPQLSLYSESGPSSSYEASWSIGGIFYGGLDLGWQFPGGR